MSEPDALSDRSSARALYGMLYDLTHSDVPTLGQAWTGMLGAEWNTLEFAQRHAEVVNLWLDTLNEMEALTPARTRQRLFSYAFSWWSALIMTEAQWQNNVVNPRAAVDQPSLDQLESACDLISAQLSGTAMAPATADLANLRAECEEWMSLLADAEEITDDSFRRTLQAQIGHLIWLIDNADAFGLSRVIQQGDQLTGALIRASHMPEGKIRSPERFKQRIIALVAVLAVVAGAVRDSGTVIGAAERSAPAIERVIHEITNEGTIEKPRETGSH